MPASKQVRKHLSADALVASLRTRFALIPDSRPDTPVISLPDALTSAFAMFALKDPSLLAFDQRRTSAKNNLRSLYQIEHVPCDTQMRSILDPLPPAQLRPAFGAVFRHIQRGKALEPFRYLDEGYLVALDGTGYYSSHKIHCP